MAIYLMLLNWTDQGMRNIKESPKRMDAAKKLAKDFGGQITTVYMTQGSFDLALVADEETILLRLREGRISQVVPNPGISYSWSVTLRGTRKDWLTFLQPEPPPFYNDLLAMNGRIPSFSIEGDRAAFVRHLRTLSRLFHLAQLMGGHA